MSYLPFGKLELSEAGKKANWRSEADFISSLKDLAKIYGSRAAALRNIAQIVLAPESYKIWAKQKKKIMRGPKNTFTRVKPVKHELHGYSSAGTLRRVPLK